MVFLLMGAVSAAEVNNVSSTEDSNLITDNDDSLSVENKLGVSNENSISQTNIVNSHDDDLNNCLDNDALKSTYEDNYGQVQTSNNNLTIDKTSNNDVLSVSKNDNLSAKPVSTSLSVSDTHYAKSATTFKVTLKGSDGKGISGQKVSLKVNGKTYSAVSDVNGIASVKTAALAIGTYNVALTYAGNTEYSSSSLSKKIKVLSSISGSNLTAYYGKVSEFKVKFWKDYDALANTKVSFNVNGVTYTKTTDKNGVAIFQVNLIPGTHVITSINPYSQEQVSNKYISLKDSTTLTHGSTSTYMTPKYGYYFTVTLKSKHGGVIKGKPIVFNYNNKKVTVNTDADGKATMTIPVLPEGTYTISYSFAGDAYYSGSSESGKVYVKPFTVTITSSKLNMEYNDGSKFAVTLKDNGKALANKVVKFKINGVTYSKTTDSKGVAYLPIGLYPGSYNINYEYLTPGEYNYRYGSDSIVVSKQSVSLTAGDLEMNYKNVTDYKVVVKDKFGKPLSGINVKFTINGKTYTHATNSKGVAAQPIGLNVGYYTMKTEISNNYYQSSAVTKHVSVLGTKFVASNLDVLPNTKVNFTVKAIDNKDNPVKGAKITFTMDGKTYSSTTDSSGVAKVSLGTLSLGTHTIKYSYGSFSGSSKISVVNGVTLSQLISASQTVKTYIEKNAKLPSSVTINGVSYSTAQYMYLASKAIINLKSGSKANIAIKSVANPSNPLLTYAAGNLNDYLSVAKSLVSTADSKGKMPDSVNSGIGIIGYQPAVYAFARVVAFYGDNEVMPSYVVIKSLDSSSTSGINPKNTISDLTPYLKASTNCQVNNSQIKKLVDSLIKGLKTDKEKATAIYNYVRDSISYSFYYNTRHGAVGTLNAKSGNCVDQSHLLVAMYRTAGLAARYAHGTCTFSSATYGHVWTQVLIGDTWTVGDPTSNRNSFGKIVNWNTNSYKLNGYYSSIGF